MQMGEEHSLEDERGRPELDDEGMGDEERSLEDERGLPELNEGMSDEDKPDGMGGDEEELNRIEEEERGLHDSELSDHLQQSTSSRTAHLGWCSASFLSE